MRKKLCRFGCIVLTFFLVFSLLSCGTSSKDKEERNKRVTQQNLNRPYISYAGHLFQPSLAETYFRSNGEDYDIELKIYNKTLESLPEGFSEKGKLHCMVDEVLKTTSDKIYDFLSYMNEDGDTLLDLLDGVSYYTNPDILNYLFIKYRDEYVICYDGIRGGDWIVYDHQLYLSFNSYGYVASTYSDMDLSSAYKAGIDSCALAKEEGTEYLGTLKIIDDPEFTYSIPDIDLISNVSDYEGYSIFVSKDSELLTICSKEAEACLNNDCPDSAIYDPYIRLDPKLYRLLDIKSS